MKKFTGFILAIAAAAGLFAQQDASKGKGGAVKGKGGGKAATNDTKASPAPPVIPQVMRLLRTDLYLVTGRGTNSVFRLTPQGVLLVDTKLGNPGEYERLVEYVSGVSKQPVKWIVNTSAKPEASGNNAKFVSAGATQLTADRPEAKLIKIGDNSAVFFPKEKVVVLGDIPKTDPAIQKLEWTLAVPPTGEPTYR